MRSHLSFLYKRLSEQLWIRPLLFSLLAVLAAFGAAATDSLGIADLLPRIDHDIVEKLLSIIAASMLGVATFAVGSMVSAYASVSSSATPRAFSLVISDDVSKTALSTFIAAFIFSVIALIAIKSRRLRASRPLPRLLDDCRGARVGGFHVRPMGRSDRSPWPGGHHDRAVSRGPPRPRSIAGGARRTCRRRRRRGEGDGGEPLYAGTIGYVQHINVEALQSCAEKNGLVVTVAALPGAFVGPGRAVAHVRADGGALCRTSTRLPS